MWTQCPIWSPRINCPGKSCFCPRSVSPYQHCYRPSLPSNCSNFTPVWLGWVGMQDSTTSLGVYTCRVCTQCSIWSSGLTVLLQTYSIFLPSVCFPPPLDRMEEMESAIHNRQRNLICGNGLKCDILKHCYRPLVFQVGKARNLSLSDSKSNQHRIAINWWWWGLYTVHCTGERGNADGRLFASSPSQAYKALS